MLEWQVSSSRITVFLRPDAALSADLFREITGADPDETSYARAQATRVSKGELDGGILSVQVQPSRCDLRLEPVPSPALLVDDTLGPFPSAMRPLVDLVKKWMGRESFPETSRLALGGVLVFPVTDQPSGYAALKEFVEGVPIASNASDFQLQLNVPRNSKVPELASLSINRLSKWSVGALRFISMSATGPGPSRPGDVSYHLRLELDVNTAPTWQASIPTLLSPLVLDDLFDGAVELAERGTRF